MLQIWNESPATENVIHESILCLNEKEHIFQLTPTMLTWQLGKKWNMDVETNHLQLKDIVTIHEPLNVIQKQVKYSIDIRSPSYSFIVTTTEKNDKDKWLQLLILAVHRCQMEAGSVRGRVGGALAGLNIGEQASSKKKKHQKRKTAHQRNKEFASAISAAAGHGRGRRLTSGVAPILISEKDHPPQCSSCGVGFGSKIFSKKKRHCHNCGYLFCYNCTRTKMLLDHSPGGKLSVCQHCETQLKTLAESENNLNKLFS